MKFYFTLVYFSFIFILSSFCWTNNLFYFLLNTHYRISYDIIFEINQWIILLFMIYRFEITQFAFVYLLSSLFFKIYGFFIFQCVIWSLLLVDITFPFNVLVVWFFFSTLPSKNNLVTVFLNIIFSLFVELNLVV